jgi:2-phospho-L-lactate guanylyltransferase (CobY/MobA/RfbA family)
MSRPTLTPARCVLLFARAPRAEAAAKGLRGGEALFALSQGRVRDTVAALPGVDFVPVPPASQSGADFGAKLESAFREATLRGYEEIVAVPGDVPELAAHDLEAAFRALSESDTVLGPSRDGGVWLIGLRAGEVALSDFFEGVPWRTRRVFEALLSNAPGSVVLAEMADVDLRTDALRMRRAARAAFDIELVAALGVLLGVSPSIRAAETFFATLAPLSLLPPSRAPPLLLLTF